MCSAFVSVARIDAQLRLRIMPLFLVHSCQGSDGLAGSGFHVSHGWLLSSSFASSGLYLGGQKDFQVWTRSFFLIVRSGRLKSLFKGIFEMSSAIL